MTGLWMPGDAQAYEHVTARGSVRVWLAAPTVIILKYRGHSDSSFVDFIATTIERTVGSRDELHLFVDCEEQTGFDAEFRSRVADFAKRIEPRTLTYCILVRSRVVAFGIAVVH